MGKGSLNISLKNFSVEDGEGFRYPLSKRFFYLYVYLAYVRSRQSEEKGGFVELEEIRHLPFWERNNLESVGKQARRHMIMMDQKGKNLIEAQQKIKGPYRLMVEPGKIHFDAEPQAISEYLRLDKLAVYYAEKQKESFYTYIDAVSYGDIHFNEGQLGKAARSYEQALSQGTTNEQKVIALQRLGRMHERLGNYGKALKIYGAAIEVLKKGANADYYDLATTYNNLAWLYHRKGNFKLAEQTYYQVLDRIRGKTHNDLLGKVYNGLGVIYSSRGKWDEAIGFFKNALALTCSEADFYGIHAAYFNIGNVYKKRADEIVKRKKAAFKEIPRSAKDLYLQAIHWTKRCNKFSERAGVGDDTSQASIVLSHCYHVLQDYPNALKYAEEAEEMATRAGNKLDIALSSKMLGKALSQMGKDGKVRARECFQRSLENYRELGDKKQVAEVEHEMELAFSRPQTK